MVSLDGEQKGGYECIFGWTGFGTIFLFGLLDWRVLRIALWISASLSVRHDFLLCYRLSSCVGKVEFGLSNLTRHKMVAEPLMGIENRKFGVAR